MDDEEITQMFGPVFDVCETRSDIRMVLERLVRHLLVSLLSIDLIAFYRIVVAESA